MKQYQANFFSTDDILHVIQSKNLESGKSYARSCVVNGSGTEKQITAAMKMVDDSKRLYDMSLKMTGYMGFEILI